MASGGTIVNQVQRLFNGLGQMVTEWQSHAGAVNTSTSPKVQYAYSEMAGGANHSRLTSVTYPSGYVLTYNYSTGLNNTIGRLSSLSDTTGSLETYDYLGLGTVVVRDHTQPRLTLTYLPGGSGDGGDKYTGLDRFGRVVNQLWKAATQIVPKVYSPYTADQDQYGYDRNSNVLWRDDLVGSGFDELYTYDGFNQLASFQRGNLNAAKTGLTGSATRSQSWDYDSTGNWDSLTTNGTAQARTANKQNEVTSIGGATTPTYDANGNMTTDETGRLFVYDAWNRLVTVKNSGGTVLEGFGYDGVSRRVTQAAGGVTTDLFYSAAWQVLEEKVGANTKVRTVWSPVYVNAMVLRDRDAGTDGTLEERLWVVQDANWNVTALVNGTGVVNSGKVVERYAYDPFGVRTVYTENYAVRAGGSLYAFQHGFQGMRFDATSGLSEAQMRWYSPTLGRWVSNDPIHFAGGDVNLYGLAGNNPITHTDPSGLFKVKSRVTFTCDGKTVTATGEAEAKLIDFKDFQGFDKRLAGLKTVARILDVLTTADKVHLYAKLAVRAANDAASKLSFGGFWGNCNKAAIGAMESLDITTLDTKLEWDFAVSNTYCNRLTGNATAKGEVKVWIAK